MSASDEYDHVKVVQQYGPGLHTNPASHETRMDPDWQRAQVFNFVDGAQLCEDLGFDGVTVTEHHGYMPSGSPHVMLAAAAMKTSHIRLGTAVTVLPLYSPIRVAEEAGLLDILSNGRFELGVGRGSGEVQFATANTMGPDEHNRRYAEGLDLLELALNQPEFTFDGQYYPVPTPLSITTRPVQKPLPVWIGAWSMGSVETAAEKGWGLMRNVGDVASHRAAVEHYIAHGRKHGRQLSGDNVMIERFVSVGATRAEADANMDRSGARLSQLLQVLTAGGRWTPPGNAEHGVTTSGRPVLAMSGTPDTLIGDIRALLEETGARQLMVAILDDDELRFLAKEVLPHIRKVKRAAPEAHVAA